MKTDIQIAQEATLQPIKEVAATIGIEEEDLELYGKYKAKISDELIARSHNNPDGKLILVTAINPTPAAGRNETAESSDDFRRITGSKRGFIKNISGGENYEDRYSNCTGSNIAANQRGSRNNWN